jgi:hypothetical protein
MDPYAAGMERRFLPMILCNEGNNWRLSDEQAAYYQGWKIIDGFKKDEETCWMYVSRPKEAA